MTCRLRRTRLEISFYFCKPYHSWERGANENTNGLIWQYIPKGTDFSGITDESVSWVENKLNNRPRIRLSIGLFIQFALMMTIYLALDGYGPAVNVSGDAAIAVITDRLFGKKKVVEA